MSIRMLALAAAATLALPHGAVAQQNCGPRVAVMDRLQNHYGETRQSIGMAAQNRVVEVFASADTGSWTITVTLPNGMMCLVASGQAFETLTEAPKPTGTPS